MFVMWTVMMVAMMGASAVPVLVVFGGFCVVAVLAQWVFHETAMLSDVMALSNPKLRGVVLMAVGVYQLTPLKNACLTNCRMPLTFLMSNWRGGLAGVWYVRGA